MPKVSRHYGPTFGAQSAPNAHPSVEDSLAPRGSVEYTTDDSGTVVAVDGVDTAPFDIDLSREPDGRDAEIARLRAELARVNGSLQRREGESADQWRDRVSSLDISLNGERADDEDAHEDADEDATRDLADRQAVRDDDDYRDDDYRDDDHEGGASSAGSNYSTSRASERSSGETMSDSSPSPAHETGSPFEPGSEAVFTAHSTGTVGQKTSKSRAGR